MSSSPPPPGYQPPPPPPGYQPPPPLAQPSSKPRNGLGLAALIVGIVAFVGAFIPLFNYAAGFIAVVGIVLGIIALVLARRPKGAAITGLVLSVLALILSVVLAIVYTFVFFGGLAQTIDQQLDENAEVDLIYQVDGTAPSATISYTTYTGGISATQEHASERLPFEQDLDVTIGGASTYNSYTLTATSGPEGGDVTCRIILDGKLLIEQTSTGAYATASCTASGTELLE